MKGIPAQTVIDEASINKLDETLIKGLGKTSEMKFLGELIGFLENSNLHVFGPTDIEKESINNSFFLRNLIDQVASGRKNIKLSKNPLIVHSDLDFNSYDHLMNVLISSCRNFESSLFKDWFSISKLPESWGLFSNNKKTTIIVGGERSIFKSWDSFELNKFPTRSIVIIDPYLLKEKDEIIINIPRIIDGLVDHRERGYKVNVLFVVDGKANKRFTLEENILRNSKVLNSLIAEKYIDKNIKFSVAYVKEEYLHDRFIFTNYYFMDAGRGFNLYNERGKINNKKPNKVTLKFLSSPEAYSEFEDAVTSYCGVVLNPDALIKLEGDLEGNEILNLVKR